MCGEQQIPNLSSSESFSDQIAERKEISERLAHFLALDEQVRTVEPVLHKTLAFGLNARAFALRDFIFVMREHQVLAAKVQIEAGAEDFHAHRAALNVPAGAPFAPRT